MTKPSPKKSGLKRVIQVVGALALLAGAVLYMQPRPVPVAMGAPEQRLVREYIAEEAKTRLAREFVLSAPVSGTVQRIALEPGDAVTADQVVVQIDPFPFEQQVKALEARIAQAEAQIQGVDKTKPKPEDIERAAVRAKALADEAQAAMRAQAEAQALREEAEKALARARGLHEKGVISQSEFDLAQTRNTTAEQALARATAGAAGAQKGVRLGDLDAQRVAGSVDDNEYLRAVYTAEVAALTAQRDAAQSDLAKTVLRAPVAGPVLEKYLSDERAVPAGTPLLKIGELASLEIESDVLSEDVGRVVVGALVELQGKAFGGVEAMGTVKRIYPSAFMKISALGVEQQRVKVLIDLTPETLKAAPALRPGTRIDVRIVTNEKQNTLAVPERAAFRRAGQWYVFRVDGGVATMVPVTLGLKNDTYAEVLEGLAAGDTIVTEPMNELNDGAPVSPRQTEN